MKRYISFILVAVLALSLVGCGADNANKENTDNTADKPINSASINQNLNDSQNKNEQNNGLFSYEEAKEKMLNITANIAEGFGIEYELNGNTITITNWKGYDHFNKSVGYGEWFIVPKTIDGVPVTRIENWAFRCVETKKCVDLNRIYVPETVSIIENQKLISNIKGAFEGIPHLEYYGNAQGAPWGAKCMNDECIYSDDKRTIISKDGKTLIAAFSKEIGGQLIIQEGIEIIKEGAFSGCEKLTSVIFPDSVKTIEKDAFSYCTGLSEVILNDGLFSIGRWAFSGCKNIPTIIVPDTVEELDIAAFSGVNHIEYHGTAKSYDGKFGANYVN